jgi:hypothetical protein
MQQGPGYGPPPGYGGYGPRTVVRHRPGIGLALGLVGIAMLLLSYFALPWASGGGVEADFSDIRDVYSQTSDYGVPVSASASDTNAEFMELYVEVIWYGIVAMAIVAVVFATWLVPRSRGVRGVIGFLVGGVLGLVINIVDEHGKVGPRLTGALLGLVCLAVHGYALSIVFGEDYSPDPAIGVWSGAAGLVVVIVGCLVGTRSERVPATGW